MESERDEWRLSRLAGRVALTMVSVAIIATMTPLWLTIMRPDSTRPRDFVQDWASARNVLVGRPVYDDQRRSMADYLGIDTSDGVNVVYNAHPPTSVVITLPFAVLDYSTAGWWWNVMSLGLLAVSLGLLAHGVGWRPSVWAIAPMVALLMVWVPLWLHTLQGQLGLVLLALFTGAWWAGRRGYWGWCGAWLGLAATVKVFPILLLGLLPLLGRWRGLVVGLVVSGVVTLATGAIVGARAFQDYVTVVIPNLDRWRPDWINSSFTGYFAHFFAPDATVIPVFRNTLLAAGTSAVAGLVVVAVVGWYAWRRGHDDFDGVYALALSGLLLLSVLTWSHYFVVLLVPLVIWARRLRLMGRSAAGRWAVLVGCWALMAIPQLDLALAVIGGNVATPIHALTVLALNFYGLLGFYVAQAWWLRPAPVPRAEPESTVLAVELVSSGERRG